ncbi:hypothetical protein HMPREF0262_03573 [Clostridium sp. ATCC 29733]|nr:hypothetical protein HMPREF0262_03573 [Clostridium sp. ATCC 29733]
MEEDVKIVGMGDLWRERGVFCEKGKKGVDREKMKNWTSCPLCGEKYSKNIY